jgi:hypothetical protein
MIIVVSGSRGWTDKEKIRYFLLKHVDFLYLVIQGGAAGADRLAKEVCEEEGITCETVRADWKRYGGAAGFIRNSWMLDRKPDLVLAFWDGTSPGTKGMIDLAHKRGVDVEVVL